MKRLYRAVALSAFLVGIAVGPVWSQSIDVSSVDGAAVTSDGRPVYFVELTGPCVEDGGTLGSILAEQAAFRGALGEVGVTFTERGSFHDLWNGLTVVVDEADVGAIRGIPGVVSVQPVMLFTLPDEPAVDQTELLTALAMTGADVAQNSLGLTGAGVKVGIIDTGIDYDHPDLGGDGVNRIGSTMFPNSRVVGGTDLVGDAFDGSNTPVPDPYPDDGCNGHGTHVAGIVGANGGIKGVAPGVSFYAYKVFGCANTTSSDAMLAAMELARADGVDIINMSIGAAFQWPSYPTAIAASKLVNKGIVLVCSQGNNGTSGLGAGSAPGVGKKVISVASFDNTFINSGAFTASPDNVVITYNPGIDAPIAPTSGTYPMARTGTVASTADACSPLPAGSLTGKVALIRRGTCGFYVKAFNAQSAGAIAVVLYNNVAGGLSPVLTPPVGQPALTIPVVAITSAAGALLDSRLATGPVDMTWTTGASSPNATGGFTSPFTSLGLSPDLAIKPDIGAPGGFIRSTVPLSQGGYANNSGTSMSSPHVAGAAALLLQSKPNLNAGQVRDILMNSADPTPFSPTVNSLNLVSRQGSGMLDIPGAVLHSTRVKPAKLSLGETACNGSDRHGDDDDGDCHCEDGSISAEFEISNKSDCDMWYDLGHEPALASGPNTFVVSVLDAPSTVEFDCGNRIRVRAGDTEEVEVTITPNATLPDHSVFSGYIVVTPDDGGADFRVTYAGYKGDYQAPPAVTPTVNNFPWLAKQVGTSFVNQPAGATYTMAGVDIPIILLHLDTPVSRLRFQIHDAVTGKNWHRALNEKDFRRSTAAASFFAFGWDGVTFTGQGDNPQAVPNGQYTLTLTALHPLGDTDNPAHTDTWVSPVITIARPDIVVEGLGISRNVVNSGDEVTLSSGITNSGAVAQEDVHVEFLDNGALLGAVDVDIAAGATELVEIPWTVGSSAEHSLEVKVTPLDPEVSYANNEASLDVILGEPIVGVGGSGTRVLSFAPSKPNPSSGNVAFRFALPEAGPVALEVFDLAGRRLKSWRWSTLEPGEHSIDWDGRTEAGHSAPTGTLLLRLNAMGRTLTQKAVRIN